MTFGIFWTGGLTNLLDIIDQASDLMFIHDLDDATCKGNAKLAFLMKVYLPKK
jgi:hypothetical protein